MLRLASVVLICSAAAAAADSSAMLRKQFAHPPAEFSTLPFLVWNGEVTEATIDRDLALYREQGISGFFIHPRPGLITPYMSDRWYELVRYTVDKAAKLGMQAWLYDENSFPSGFAGGHVPATMPESWNGGQGLKLTKLTALAPGAAAKCKVLLKRSGDGFEDVTAAAASQPASGEYSCFEVAFYSKSPWYGGFTYVDLLRPGVTEKFIELTMRGYERSLGSELGRTVPGIFTDEPNLDPIEGTIRWTPDLFAEFQKRRGYDLRPVLNSLLEETGDWRRVRHDYFATVHDLFVDHWGKPWNAYTEKKGLLWTGHYWDHSWPDPHGVPDNMSMYAWHQEPAIDLLFNQFDEEKSDQFGDVRIVKELASVANQLGRKRTLSETYGAAGWDLRFEDMKRLGDWEYVLGVNSMNQHLTFQTLAGARKYDFPQSFSYHAPWWKHYRVLADYYRRLSLALSSGEQVNRTLVIEPTTTAWMYAPATGKETRLAGLEQEFRQFVNALERRQAEYDLGAEGIIRDHGRVAGPRFAVGRREYDTVVLPPGTANLDGSTVALLAKYLEAGGAVVSFVEPPARVDGAESARLRELAAAAGARWVRANSPDEEPVRGRILTSGFTDVSGKLYHHRRQLGGGELLFLVNSALDARAGATVRVAGKSLSRLDAFTGTVEPYPANLEDGRLVFQADLDPAGSLLLLVSPSAGPAPAAPKPAPAKPVEAATPLVAKRAGPNVLTIDYCDLNLAGASMTDRHFFDAAAAAFKKHGFAEGDPWASAVQYKSAILDRNHFPPDSGFDAVYHFEVAEGVNAKGFQAVIERPALWRVSINGQTLEPRPGAWWLDRDFGVYDIGAHVKTGANSIRISAHPMSVHAEIEPIYILGEFGAAPAGKGFRIVPARDLALGPWKEQLLPFYSGTVSYTRSYKLRRAATKVRLGKWDGTVAEVKVNGVSAGVIGWAPWELDISRLVRGGKNDIEVVVYGSLRNLLGPHHRKSTPGLVTPWSWRYMPEHMPAGADYSFYPYGLAEPFEVLSE